MGVGAGVVPAFLDIKLLGHPMEVFDAVGYADEVALMVAVVFEFEGVDKGHG